MLLGHHGALELERRGELAALLREVPLQQRPLLHKLRPVVGVMEMVVVAVAVVMVVVWG